MLSASRPARRRTPADPSTVAAAPAPTARRRPSTPVRRAPHARGKAARPVPLWSHQEEFLGCRAKRAPSECKGLNEYQCVNTQGCQPIYGNSGGGYGGTDPSPGGGAIDAGPAGGDATGGSNQSPACLPLKAIALPTRQTLKPPPSNSSAAEPVGPTPCPMHVCANLVYCPYRPKTDANGCDTCECAPPPTCSSATSTAQYGHQKDANGCDICACNPPPACLPLACPDLNYCVYRAEERRQRVPHLKCNPGPVSCPTPAPSRSFVWRAAAPGESGGGAAAPGLPAVNPAAAEMAAERSRAVGHLLSTGLCLRPAE